MFWSEVPKKGRNGIVRKYRLLYKESNAPWNDMVNFTLTVAQARINQNNHHNGANITNISVAEDRYSTNITGLKIFTNYTIVIQAITVATGVDSVPLIVSTDEDRKCSIPAKAL